MADMKVVLGAKEWLENDEKDSLRIQILHKGDCPTYGHEETIELLEAFSSSQAAAHLAEVDRLTKQLEEVLDILWRDIDDLRDPKLSVVMVAAKASNAIYWRNNRILAMGKKLEAAEQRISELTSANEKLTKERDEALANSHHKCEFELLGRLERMQKALNKMNEDALHQVKVLFDAELYHSRKGDVAFARANDDKARFLMMYFPEIVTEAFAYRESLGADEVLRLALKALEEMA